MESLTQFLTEKTVVLAALGFVFLIAFFYCWMVTGNSPLALMVQLVEEGKNRIDPDKGGRRESSQEKRIKAIPSESVSLTGGIGNGTVSEVLAQQTNLLLQEGTVIQDDFTTDLVAGECPEIERFLERTDKDAKE